MATIKYTAVDSRCNQKIVKDLHWPMFIVQKKKKNNNQMKTLKHHVLTVSKPL